MNQYNVQDPSGLVPDPVLPHVHLISTYRFPTFPTLLPAQALEYLIKGPQIVKDTSAVAWTYFPSPPPDGTLLMTWQPPRLQTQFASDGMVWADPEMAYEMEIRGYTLQCFIHRSGYHYPNEPFASHARYRYRILRGPGATDPSLWIVHYSMADPNARVPSNHIQLAPEVLAIIRQRANIEQHGQLTRKEFMLRDRANWPTVEFQQRTGQQRAQPYYNPMQPGFMPMQQNQPTRPIGQPPNKRQRQQPPVPRGAAPAPVVADASLEEEENATQDTFDFLTPRDISISRYKQHHEWMEEIFNSPYAADKILAVDLGLGLMGELAPLTNGILDAPAGERPPVAGETPKKQSHYDVKSYRKLNPEQLKEFEKRVTEYTTNEEAELERMRAAHTKKMADLKRSRTYIKAERRLRALDGASEPDGSSLDPVNAVVKELEKALSVTFDTKKQVVCIDKGGFIEEQQAPPQKPRQMNGDTAAASSTASGDNGSNSLIDEAALDVDNSAGGLLDQYGSNSLTGTPGANLSVPQTQPPSQAQSAVATPNVPGVDSSTGAVFDDQTNLGTGTDGDDLLDLDVEMSGMTNTEDKGGEADWVMVDDTAGQQSTSANAQQTNASGQSANQPSLPASGVDPEPTSGFLDAADFGSFDTAGDALADYTNADDNMGLDLVDDSAFGDAFHGTELHHGETEDSENV